MASAGAAMDSEVNPTAMAVETESGSDLDDKPATQAPLTEEEPKVGPEDSASISSQGGKSLGSVKSKEAFRQEYREGNAARQKEIEEMKEDARKTQEELAEQFKKMQEEFHKELKEKLEDEKAERTSMTKKYEDKEK